MAQLAYGRMNLPRCSGAERQLEPNKEVARPEAGFGDGAAEAVSPYALWLRGRQDLLG